MTAFSYHVSITCSGENDTIAASCCSAIASALAAEFASCTASASVNSNQSPQASLAPIHTALFFPTQPAGNSAASSNRTFINSAERQRTISAVRSVDWSLTTSTSEISSCTASDLTHAAITASSFRAGTTALTHSLFVVL